MLKNLLIVLTLVFLMPWKAMAQENQEGVTLLIWVEDDSALKKKDYDIAMDLFQKNGISNIRTAYFDLALDVERDYRVILDHALHDKDKISNIILATHGESSVVLNKTTLVKLGGFGAKGSYGALSDILKYISPRFGDKLHIYMDACSTFCGSQSAVSTRSNGLLNELRSYGISQISIWGARKNLASHATKHIDPKKEFIRGMGVVNKIAVKNGALGTVAVFILLTINSDLTTPHAILNSAAMGTVTGLFSVVSGYLMIANIISASGKMGYLVTIDENGTRILKTERTDRASITGNIKSCRQFFL